jgi:predicted nuclease of predicted toxin-antitoxin system
MKFIVDAQLPRRLGHQLKELGHDAIHTLDLPDGNRTPDIEINRLSVDEQRVVITKDADFVDSLIVKGVPYKLLLVSTGNFSNKDFESLFFNNLDAIMSGFESLVFIEIDHESLRFHF